MHAFANILDPGKDVAELKQKAEEVVRRKLGDDPEKRVVVFIDDLDRLSPLKAVELLEAFKLFLEIPGCVYILACDYQVVSQGLKMKFGVSSQELKGKSFFDKIIQLPFQMPVSQYTLDTYITQLLKNIKIDFEPEDITQYQALIESSIGFNPRNLKRVFNCFLLLNLVASKKEGLFEELAELVEKNEIQKILFASICLQRAYEGLYHYLIKNAHKINAALLNQLSDETSYESDSSLKDLLDAMRKDEPNLTVFRLTHFSRALCDLLRFPADQDEQQGLSQDKISALRGLLTFAGLTSSGDTLEEPALDRNLRRCNLHLVKALLPHFQRGFRALRENFGNKDLRVYQPRDVTYARLGIFDNGTRTILGRGVALLVDGDEYEVYLYNVTKAVIEEIGLRQHLAEALLPSWQQAFVGEVQGDDDVNWVEILDGTLPEGLNEKKTVAFLKQAMQDCLTALNNFLIVLKTQQQQAKEGAA